MAVFLNNTFVVCRQIKKSFPKKIRFQNQSRKIRIITQKYIWTGSPKSLKVFIISKEEQPVPLFINLLHVKILSFCLLLSSGGLDLSLHGIKKELTTAGWLVIIILLLISVYIAVKAVKTLRNKFKGKLK